MTSPSPGRSPLPPAWTQSTVADFTSGSQSNTQVSATTWRRQVSLAAAFSDDFTGELAQLELDDDLLGPLRRRPDQRHPRQQRPVGRRRRGPLDATIPNGSGVQGSVNFGAAPYQNFGMATRPEFHIRELLGLFSTQGTTNTLFAQVNVSGTTQSVNLGALPAGFHDYLIQPVAGGIQFSVDGVALATINLTIPSGTPLGIAMSSFNGSPHRHAG